MNVAFCFACAAMSCCGVMVAPPPWPLAARSASRASWATRRFRSARTNRIISNLRCVYVSCLNLCTVGSTPFTSKESRGRIRRISGFRPCRKQASADRGVRTIFDGGGLRSALLVLETLSQISSMVWAFWASTDRLPRPLPMVPGARADGVTQPVFCCPRVPRALVRRYEAALWLAPALRASFVAAQHSALSVGYISCSLVQSRSVAQQSSRDIPHRRTAQ